jgi:hypothetical protein
MKKYLALFSCQLALLQLSAQADSSTCAGEINREVWKPFVKHFISSNKKGFQDLHSKRVTRVLIDDNRLEDYNNYFPQGSGSDSTLHKQSPARLFELRFDKRICNGTKAWESGFYKGTMLYPGKRSRVYYGRFFVVLEKEEGAWKIIVDADTGKDATATNFKNARPME